MLILLKAVATFLLGIGIFVVYLVGRFIVMVDRVATANANPSGQVGSGQVGWDVVSMVHNISVWTVTVPLLVSFLIGYAMVRALSK
jgi:hypothetical protein